MNTKDCFNMVGCIMAGDTLHDADYRSIAELPESDFFNLVPGADALRRRFFGKTIHLCTILNGKSGRCSEDCRFCSQSRYAETDAPVFPLKSREELVTPVRTIDGTPVNRYAVVTSGRGLSASEVEQVAGAFHGTGESTLSYCASLGIIEDHDLRKLRRAGVSRYHHNLETAESHFGNICTTHLFADRVQTIRAAKAAGMSICAGGLFGIGETDEQVLELAMTLKSLDVDAVPVNFLSPIPGTPLESADDLTPARCIKIIALLRYVLPEKEIIICGGRSANLGPLHPLIFFAGASGIMTGNYLTTAGRTLEEDLEMIRVLDFSVREKTAVKRTAAVK